MAQNVKLIAKGNLEHGATANSRKKLVRRSTLKRSSRNVAVRFIQQHSPVDEARLENGTDQEHYTRETTSVPFKKTFPDMIEGLTPYQIFRKAHQSNTRQKDLKFSGKKDLR